MKYFVKMLGSRASVLGPVDGMILISDAGGVKIEIANTPGSVLVTRLKGTLAVSVHCADDPDPRQLGFDYASN